MPKAKRAYQLHTYDWEEYDALRAQGLSERAIAKRWKIPQATLTQARRRRERNGTGTPPTGPAAPATLESPAIPATLPSPTPAVLPIHPLADIFPPMNESTFNDLKADIAAYGLREPIWLYEGQILDGRNRHRACRELALAGPTRDYQGNDPLGFILSMNLHRRHLDESQRAMVAAKIANMRQGERTDLQPSENSPKVSQAKAAEMLNISDFSLKAAKKVYAEAQPEVIRAVETGTMAVSAAAKLAEQPVAVQRTVVKALESGSAKTVRVALQHATTAHNGQAPTPATPPLTADEDAFDKRLTHTHEYFAKVAKSDIVERLGEKFTEGDIQHWTQRLVQLRETTTDLATRMWKAFRGEGGEP